MARAQIRSPGGDLLTEIDCSDLGWETYGIPRADERGQTALSQEEALTGNPLVAGKSHPAPLVSYDARER